MAIIRKSKLSWTPSHSDQVIAYKLYWSKERKVTYESNSIELGDVNEVYFPDIIKNVPPNGISLWLGITAVDLDGNESDITHLPATYQVKIPPAPTDLALKPMDDFTTADSSGDASKDLENDPLEKQFEKLAGIAERIRMSNQQEARGKYYDDIGFRNLDTDE